MFKNVVKEQLKVPAHVDYLADLREFVTRIGNKYGFSDRVVNAFKLAIDEAGTNVMRHAYRDTGGEGFITIRAIVKNNSLTICLIDQGKYFDPKHVKDPDLQRYVDIGKKGGLGIFIMRRLMDEIDYRKTEEGNELRLTKNRDTPAGRFRLGMPLPQMAKAFKTIPFSLKAKYWMRTTLVLLGIISAVYGYYFWQAEQQETAQFFNDFIETSKFVSNRLNDPRILEDGSGILARGAIATIQVLEQVRKDIREIILVDPTGMVLGHTDTTQLYQQWNLPSERREVRPGIVAYTVPVSEGRNGQAGREVYDHVITLQVTARADDSNARVLNYELHTRALKEGLNQRIVARRWAYGRVAGFALVASAVGAVFLIYILMNPFRKLADWVRRADHGEIQDEMDIDASTEIGEIAQAFSEITNKFRASQKNLAEQERLQKEMQVAQEIQQTLLPSEFPDLEGYELASFYEAAREVGGDYYDFVEVDKDTLGIAVADVSGKGVPGSLVMTMIRTALRTEARGLKDAAEVLSRVNDFVIGDMKKGMFVTVFYVIIDSKRRRLNYASAGHNPMILYRASTQKTYYLNPRGFPIGIQLHEKDLFKKSIESDTIQLAEEDILLIYTDGITEAMNAERDLFGEERLLKIFREHGQLRVKPFVEQIKEDILSFTEGTPQSDDITLVAVREKTSPEKEELRRAREAHRKTLAGTSIREACESVGITTYAYYNKYKKEFEEKGAENFEIDADVSVEAKHIAIEDKVKIYDIIKNHPEYGAKRISEELNTEKYGFALIAESKIYDELVRSRLNTRQLREAFVARGGRTRRPMKQPGTPMLTLDGKIILDRDRVAAVQEQRKEKTTAPQRRTGGEGRESEERRSAMPQPAVETPAKPFEPPAESFPRRLPAPATSMPVPAFARSDHEIHGRPPSELVKSVIDLRTLQTPLEELLDKKRLGTSLPMLPEGRESGTAVPALPSQPLAPPERAPDEMRFESLASRDKQDLAGRLPQINLADEPFGGDKSFSSDEVSPPEAIMDFLSTVFAPAPEPAETPLKGGPSQETQPAGTLEISFEDLFAGGSILEERSPAAGATPETARETPARDAELPPQESQGEDDSGAFFAVDEVLRQELESSFSSVVTEAAAPENEPDNLSQVFDDSPPQAEVSEPPAEADLPYVDVHEILEQDGAESGARLVDEPAVKAETAKATTTPPEDFPEWPEGALQQALHKEKSGNGTHHGGEANYGGFAQTSEAKDELLKSVTPTPVPERRREDITSAAVRPRPSTVPDRHKESGNGAGRREDDRERLLIAGLRHYKNQRFQEAIAEFEKAIRIYPDFKEAFSILGNAYFRNRMYEQAASAYLRVKEMDPDDTTAYENMGVIYANRGEYMEAVKEWQRVLEIDPGRDDIRKKIKRASRMLTQNAVV
ncbi:SpoIIE family protein phosphatase [candidate division KSB1 bacterium]|nr:SpoIIE family protein phosphatase [candidate division KSB1 bacterium]